MSALDEMRNEYEKRLAAGYCASKPRKSNEKQMVSDPDVF